MSNVLIIKHGSLGDIVQISGVLRDLRAAHKDDKIFILTTAPYIDLLSRCPYIDAVLLDKRLPRWNFFYLMRLKRLLKKFSFSHVYDLQNSKRSNFYRKYLLRAQNWISSKTSLKKRTKKDFIKYSVLQRFKYQLEDFNIKTEYTLKPDFSWACANVDQIVNKYFGKNFLLIFPFCSPQLSHKKWPYYNQLIEIIRSKHPGLEIALVPGPAEIEDSKKFDAVTITNRNDSLNIMELAGLIKKSSFIIANDTGPAHMAAHLGKEGIVLFGYHTTPEKVSIETDKFKAVTVADLKNLSANEVYLAINKKLELINQI